MSDVPAPPTWEEGEDEEGVYTRESALDPSLLPPTEEAGLLALL